MLKANIQKVYFNDEKYGIHIQIEVPIFFIKNELNFRIFQIKKNNKEYIRDPSIKDSNYVYNIPKEDLGKKSNILFEFSKDSFEEIEEFFFDFCDENYKWLNYKIFYKNKYCKSISLEENKTNIISTDLSKKKNNISILSESFLIYLNSEEFLNITNE